MITATRFHDFSYGHRVHGHESKCAFFHGHNGRVHFTVMKQPDAYEQAIGKDSTVDTVGRVMDFSVINTKLCQWLEDNWDHRFLISMDDPRSVALLGLDPGGVKVVPFNPTAENMAKFLLEVIGPKQLAGTGCTLIKVTVEETRKCSATVEIPHIHPWVRAWLRAWGKK